MDLIVLIGMDRNVVLVAVAAADIDRLEGGKGK